MYKLAKKLLEPNFVIVQQYCDLKEESKEEFYSPKESIKVWEFDADDIVILKLIEKKNNSKYLIGNLDDVIRPFVLILHKIDGYVRTFKDKDGDKDKNEINKLMSSNIDDGKLFKKYKTISTKTEELQNIELKALPVYLDRYIKPN